MTPLWLEKSWLEQSSYELFYKRIQFIETLLILRSHLSFLDIVSKTAHAMFVNLQVKKQFMSKTEEANFELLNARAEEIP